MKYTALTPIKHDGRRLEEGATFELTKQQAERLVQSGAVEPFDPAAAKAKADAEAAEKSAADALLEAENTAGKLV